mgnify:CR=1 FL=1
MSSTNFEIKSDWLECQTSTQRLMAFLSDIQHLESILPKDKIKNFQVLDKDKIRFDIENIITLTLHITPIPSPNSDKNLKSNPSSLFNAIQYTSEPFGNYYLILKALFDNQKSQIVLTGYLNPFVLSYCTNASIHTG